jgi:hypothetical protein
MRARASNSVGYALEWSNEPAAANFYTIQNSAPGTINNLTMVSPNNLSNTVRFTWTSINADSYEF